MISADGYGRYNIWEHSATVRELYARRCRQEAEEMTCHVQAAQLLAPLAAPGDVLLDAGCGSGYFYHSLRTRGIGLRYLGVDAAPSLVRIGRELLPEHGLDPQDLHLMRIEDMDGQVDHVTCINVLSNIDNYHRPLERLLKMARKSVILRESCAAVASYTYVRDAFLDEGVDLKVHVNTYAIDEIRSFAQAHGYRVDVVTDQRAGDGPEMVIGHPHYWKFLVCTRLSG